MLGNDVRSAHTAENAEHLLKVLVGDDLEVMEEVQASGVKGVRRVRRGEESEGGQIVLGDGHDHHAERQLTYHHQGTHLLVSTISVCGWCEQWLVLLARELDCTLFCVS